MDSKCAAATNKNWMPCCGHIAMRALHRRPASNFMPNLWQRIESRQSFTFSFQRMANALVTAAVAFSIALGVYMSMPHNNPSYANQSYIEALADANPVDAPEIVGPVRLDPGDLGK